MKTDAIDKKLQEMARKELRQKVTNFVEDLKKSYPKMYNTHHRIETGGYCKQSADKNIYFYADSGESTLEHFLQVIIEGLYKEGLHKKKVNDLVSKLEIFE